MGTHGKINAILSNINVNPQKLVDSCGYKLQTNLQNFMQKDLTKVKIFKKSLRGYFFETPCIFQMSTGDTITRLFCSLKEHTMRPECWQLCK